MKKVCAWALVCLAVMHGEGFAYKQRTHTIISGHAAQQSNLEDPAAGILRSLDLGDGVDDRMRLLPSTSRYSLTLTPMRLMQRGADDEDLGRRSLRHFYDVQRDGAEEESEKGLVYDLNLVTFTFDPSTLWSLEPVEVDEQEFSYVDAKRMLLDGIVGPTQDFRDRNLGKVFEALGHVIHHVQDMAQPQHVRNDIHCDEALNQLFESSWIAFPLCPLGGAYRPSAYEEFTQRRATEIPLAGYGTVDYGTFDQPAKFWDGGGIGIAAFTSKNFVSSGSNLFEQAGFMLSDPEHPEPKGFIQGARQITEPELLGPQGPNQPLSGEIRFVATSVVDGYRGGRATNMFASTYSIFDAELKQAGAKQVFTMNRFNYAAANDFLLPRATAYSTGLINYFFRGRIEITLPGEGVYGVIDHATTYATGQGFAKLKLKLRNASPDGVKPDGTRVPQTMQGGTLVAVAKYTLNGCYQPDLSGDYGQRYDTGAIVEPVNCTFAQYLAGEEQISQSTAILAASLDPVTATEFTFDFASQPIPVNARDLRVQVVYTGTLGAEADAIAFGGRDISEPTHLVIYNSSDYFAVDGKLYTPAQIRSDPALSQRVAGLNIDPRPLTGLMMAVVPGKPIVGASGAVPVNGYVRVAVLANPEAPISLSVLSRFEGTGFSEATFPRVWPTVVDLRSPEGYITPYGIFRGPRGSFFDVLFKANSSAPLASGELVNLSGRLVADPGPTQIPVRF